MSGTARTALVVVSGGRPFEFGELFRAKGRAIVAARSHRIDLTSTTIPAVRRIDYILFTSQNAVAAVRRAGLASDPTAQILAVGASTRAALSAAGLEPHATSETDAAGLLAALPEDLSGKTILWPRGNDSDRSFEDALTARGASVVSPIVYQKIPLALPAGLAADIRAGRFSAFAVTSASAGVWLFDSLDRPEHDVLRETPAAVLGRASEEALTTRGVKRVVRAEEASFESLAEKLLELVEETPPAKVG